MWKISAPVGRNLLRITAFALCSLPVYGQTANTGAIAGSVSDPSAAPVAGAAEVINREATGEERDLTTNAEGIFSVPFLTPRNYDPTAATPGLKPLALQTGRRQITQPTRRKTHLTNSRATDQITV